MRKKNPWQIQNKILKYGFAVAMTALSVGWRFAMMPLIGPGYQYVTVFPLIIIVAILAGRGPAILHAVLAGALSTYYFTETMNVPAVLVTGIVILTGALAGDLAQRLRNALNQARQKSEDLTRRESLIRSITQNTDVMIGALDNGFRFIFLNEAYRRRWQEIWHKKIDLGTNLLEVTSPWPREQRKGKQLWSRAFKGESFRATVDFGPTEQERRLFDIHFNPIYDTEGRQVGAAQIMRDITEQVKTEEAASQTELFYRQTLESIPGMVFTTLPDGYCDYQSRQWVEYTGVPMNDMLGSGWNKLLHPEDRRRAIKAWRAAVEGLAPYDLEYRVRRYDGLYEWFKVRGQPIRDASGTIVRWFGVATNVNDLKKTAEALRDSKMRFRGIFENAATGMTLVDLDGNWIDVNQTFCNMIGYTKEALIGTSFLVLTVAEDVREDMRRYDALKRGLLDSYSIEKRYRHKDGHILWLNLHRALQRDESGKPLYSISVVIDITERKRAEKALRQSEEQFRGMFNRHGAVKLVIDPETGGIFDANNAAVKFYGYSHEQLCSMRIGDINQLTKDQIAAERQLAAAEERNYFIFPHRLADGTVRTVEVYSTPVPIGGKIRLYSIIHDITERRQAEEALRQSERQFRQLADSMPQIVWAARPDGVVDYFNRKWEEVTTGDLSRIGDQGWISALHPDDVERVRDAWYESIRTGEPYYSELRLNVPDSSDARWYIARAVPIRDEQGQIVRWFGTATDIHELKQVQESLKASEQRYRALFESIDEGFCIIEMIFDSQQTPVDYRFVEINPAFERHTGLGAIQGQTMRSLVPDHEAHWFEIYGQVALTGQPRRFVNEAKALNRWFDVYAFRFGAPHEHKVAALFDDITQFKRAQQEMLQYRDQLESKNKEMESIIGIVSHDLRAPLVNIQGFSHELQADCKTLDTTLERVSVEAKVERQIDKLLHHSIPESLHYVQTSAEAMSRLVVTLVEVARAGMAPTSPERIDMDILMDEIASNLKMKFNEANVSYDIEPLPGCFADRTQVTQIFTNLLDNAVKYLHPDRRGAICVKGEPQADGVLYSVSDNGIGISQDQQEKVFEPYYQLKEKASGGVGMGLATVKKMVERNNGKIWVVSEKGKYSIFYVALPVS